MKRNTAIAILLWILGVVNIVTCVWDIIVTGFSVLKIPLGIIAIPLGFVWWKKNERA